MKLEQAAQSLRITLDQLVHAKATCEGCDHRKPGDLPLGVNCCQKPSGGCNKFVQFNSTCPAGKWNNKPATAQEPADAKLDDAAQLFRLQVIAEKQKRRGIRLGDRVVNPSERPMLKASRAG